MRLFSYVVRYDSGFAPNPFYGHCTLATCKPPIRRTAAVGDWIIGTGSASLEVKLGGHLVYAMRVGEILTFEAYDADPRFEKKKPYRRGSRKQSCGDNIYYRAEAAGNWTQRDSFHSCPDGSPRADHIAKDTGVNRVLIGDEFVYFGGQGPAVPTTLIGSDGRPLCKSGMGYQVFDDPAFIERVVAWLHTLGLQGYEGAPFEWMSFRD